MSKPEETPIDDVDAASPAEPAEDAEVEPAPARKPNELNISAKRRADQWVPQIRLLLRQHETVELGALGKAMHTLSDAVQTLTQEGVATKISLVTELVDVNVRPRRGNNANPDAPRKQIKKSKLTVKLGRGEKYFYLYDYRARQVMKLFDAVWQSEHKGEEVSVDDFEKVDTIPVERVRALGLDFGADTFGAADAPAAAKEGDYKKAQAEADKVLKEAGGQIGAEAFAKYVSHLVGPHCDKSPFDDILKAKLAPFVEAAA